MDVHELLAEIDKAGETASWREPYAAALAALLKKDFATARTGFQKVIEMRKKDGPSKYLLHAIEEMITSPPEGEWDGVIEMHEK